MDPAKVQWKSINEDTSSHMRSLRKSGAYACFCADSLCHCGGGGFSPQRGVTLPPPDLPISPCARYGESDDGVLEQLLQGPTPSPPSISDHKGRVQRRHSGKWAVMYCVKYTSSHVSWKSFEVCVAGLAQRSGPPCRCTIDSWYRLAGLISSPAALRSTLLRMICCFCLDGCLHD